MREWQPCQREETLWPALWPSSLSVLPHLANFHNSCKFEGLIATQKGPLRLVNSLRILTFKNVYKENLLKLWKKVLKNFAFGKSLCSKRNLCKFGEFLREILRFFAPTMWQHCSRWTSRGSCRRDAFEPTFFELESNRTAKSQTEVEPNFKVQTSNRTELFRKFQTY